MAITDIIEETELTAGAPSIKYEGDMNPDQGSGIMQMASMESGQEGTLEEIYFELIADGMDPEAASIKAREIYNSMSSQPQDMMQEPRTMAAEGGMMVQGGVKNYLGKQKTISNVPVKWKSAPNHPQTELAYITKAEKDLLLKKDLHDSLDGGPNRGPGGLMSLNGGGYGSEDKGTNNDGSNNPGGGNNDYEDQSYTNPSPPPDRGPNEPDNKPGRPPIDTSRYTNDEQDRNNREAIERGIREVQQQKEEEEEKKKKEEEKKKKQTKKVVDDQTKKKKKTLKDILNFFDESRTKIAKKTLINSAAQKLGMMPKSYVPSFLMGDMTRKTPPGVTLEGLDQILGVEGRDKITGKGSMTNPFEVDYSMSQYGLGGKDLTRAREQLDVAGQDRISQNDFDSVYGYQPVLPMGEGRGAEQQFIPTTKKEEEEVEEEEPFQLGLAFRADGGRVGKAYGGSMGDDGRRAYGLGSIFKKIKKVFKSPLGKAALLGLGGYGLAGGLGGSSFMTGLKSQGLSGLLKKAGSYALKNPGVVIPAASAAAALFTDEEEEDTYVDNTGINVKKIRANPYEYLARANRAEGGPMGGEIMEGESEELLDMNGMEKDYREDGGFVPIGEYEKKDDVPARLSKNEFVFTADAVRGAGEGDVDLGAEKLYTQMKELESVGKRMQGANEMFQTSQRLEEVI